MKKIARPLSPHLQIYRWPLSVMMSITHRATGIALSFVTILRVWWLVAAADGPEAYATLQWFLGSWMALLLLFDWSLALFFHLCNGIRHLWWDTGRGLDLRSVDISGRIVLAATAALTIAAWVIGLLHWSH